METKLPRTEQPQLYLNMHIAQYRLQQGDTEETNGTVEEAKDTLDSLTDVRPRDLQLSALLEQMRSCKFDSLGLCCSHCCLHGHNAEPEWGRPGTFLLTPPCLHRALVAAGGL